MELFPAIDLRAGRCVRLVRGDFDQETVYGDDPVAQAVAFAEAGSAWLHVVDLDAARTGDPANRAVVAAIAAAVGPGTRIQSGGGVRDRAAAEALLDAGVARVVVGTAALEDPAFVRELARDHGGRVAVGLDVRGIEVAVRGWVEGSGRSVGEVAAEFADAGVDALVVTQIHVDGTLAGPDLAGLSDLLGSTTLDVLASGGVGTLDHIRSLATLVVGGRHLSGAIVGKALYEGAFTVAEAVDASAAD
ncbi:MAG: 1-(5-phosphoribosyl)-5-[(5-phosphoribosylamino)methylideneamino]imidazole-4-carboxamide isomerase [Acidimicrobiales bacterium]